MAGEWLSALGAALEGGLGGYQWFDNRRRAQQAVDDERDWRAAQVNERRRERELAELKESHRAMQQITGIEGQGRSARAVLSKMRPELASAFEGLTDRDLGAMNDNRLDALLRYSLPPKPEKPEPPRYEVRSDPTTGATFRLNLDNLAAEPFMLGGAEPKPLNLTPRPRAPRAGDVPDPARERKDKLAELATMIDDARSMATASPTLSDRRRWTQKADSLMGVREQVQRGDGQSAPVKGGSSATATAPEVDLGTTKPQRTPAEAAYEDVVRRIQRMALPPEEKQRRIQEATRRFNAQRGAS